MSPSTRKILPSKDLGDALRVSAVKVPDAGRWNSRSRMELVCASDRSPRSRLLVVKWFVIKKSFLNCLTVVDRARGPGAWPRLDLVLPVPGPVLGATSAGMPTL